MPDFRVGKPRLSVHRSTDIVMAFGYQPVPVDVVDFDDVGGWDGATFSYTLDRPGLWIVELVCRRLAAATAGAVSTEIYRNGVGTGGVSGPASTAAQTVLTVRLLELSEGDVIQPRVRLHSTVNQTLVAAETRFWLTRLGPKAWT